jgi:hypothetical protein
MQIKHVVGILVLLAAGLLPAPAHAAGVVAVCDEAHLLVALAGGGTVTFSCSGVIALSAEITIAADTTIDGAGQTVTISGNHAVRVFHVNAGITLNLNELTVANGRANSGGGGINNHGTVNVGSSTFSDNNADRGGGILNGNDGTLTVSNSTFSGNSGGILNDGGAVTVSNSTFSGNSANAAAGCGGGICNREGMLTVNNSAFVGNSASNGGGIAILNGVAEVSNSSFSNNNASDGAGIQNYYGGTLAVSNSTLSGNRAINGGGIANTNVLTVIDSTFSGNVAEYSGGIANADTGRLTVSDSTFSGNSATFGGGGIRNGGGLTVSNSTFTGNSASYDGGGGIYSGIGSTLTVINSTFSGNSAAYTIGGGGIYSGYRSTLTVTNNIVSGSTGWTRGGGIANAASTVIAAERTIAANEASSGRNTYSVGIGATVTLKNTIVADSAMGDNCSGIITDGGGNLSYPDASCPGINLNPYLYPLQDNGGPTATMALGPGSAALDAGDDATCVAAPVNNLDQRGEVRPKGSRCDIGAIEQEPYPKRWLPIAFRR